MKRESKRAGRWVDQDGGPGCRDGAGAGGGRFVSESGETASATSAGLPKLCPQMEALVSDEVSGPAPWKRRDNPVHLIVEPGHVDQQLLAGRGSLSRQPGGHGFRPECRHRDLRHGHQHGQLPGGSGQQVHRVPWVAAWVSVPARH